MSISFHSASIMLSATSSWNSLPAVSPIFSTSVLLEAHLERLRQRELLVAHHLEADP
jgi:hypothetical protein